MAKAAAKTGADPTVLVAIEQYFSEGKRIIEDNMAYQLLPSGRFFLWIMHNGLIRSWMIQMTEKNFPGLWNCMMCRKQYIDEKLIDAVNKIESVVNLGAGSA